MSIEVRQQLLDALKRIDRPGTFCASGRLPPTFPGLEVEGVGAVALPLGKRQAGLLKKQARQAPYGKGTETLVDTDVRRVWEIDADQVALGNPEWPGVVEDAVRSVQSALGLEKQKLEAHLYKLLLYEPGSFFLAHQDGEKLDRMVATLVISLPSAHEGGELVVRHEGREEVFDLGPESQFQTQFAAFYADCEHEVRPVRSGFRLSLVYNLTLSKSKKRAVLAPRSGEHIAKVEGILKQWHDESRTVDDDSPLPTKLAVLLDYKYTEAGLTYDALKGTDRAKADVLVTAASRSGFDAPLALVTYWENGSAESSGGYGYDRYRRYGYASEDEGPYIMDEVFDTSLTAEHFRDADGNSLAFGKIPLDEEEIVSDAPLNEGEPDEEDFEGYTGNAGMTLDRWYRRAAIVLWPVESRFDALCEAGVEAAVGGLAPMVGQWKKAKKSDKAGLKQECVDFARRIIAHWPERKYAASYGRENVSKVPLLPLLETLGEPSLISEWVRGVLARDASVDPGKALGDLCQEHGWLTFQDELRDLFQNTANETILRHARVLADLSLRKEKSADRKAVCSLLAGEMMSAVEKWNPSGAERDWQSRPVDGSELLPPLVQSFLILKEEGLLERLSAYVLARTKDFSFTTAQIPALVGLETWLKRNVKRFCPPLRQWLTAIRDELEERVSDPPKEPTDWKRESSTGCKCEDCKELSLFLKDPKTETGRFPLAKDRRQHLHRVIDEKQLDATHVTERQGRPYTLVCKKTKASYQRALKAHQLDLDQRGKILKLVEWQDGLKKGG